MYTIEERVNRLETIVGQLTETADVDRVMEKQDAEIKKLKKRNKNQKATIITLMEQNVQNLAELSFEKRKVRGVLV